MQRVWSGASRPSTVRVARVACALVVATIAGLYIFNSARHNEPTLFGDQWFWIHNVIVPYDDGRLSLFDAITFEYQSFAHSHVPTLIVLLVSYKWFGLTSTFDTVIGVVSLAGVFLVAWRHMTSSGSPLWAQLGLAAAGSMVFVSSAPFIFAWSLLQFQMLFVLVAVLYLFLFARQVETPSIGFAVASIPAAMILGDAIGAAAVAASLLYLALLVVLRRVPWQRALPSYVVFGAAVGLLGPLLRGRRLHGGQSATDFVDFVLAEPGEVVKSFYYALAQGFVALRPEPGLLGWRSAWVWFVLGAAVVVPAAIGLWRGGLERSDHFPLMLVVASLIWTLGVVRARVEFLGPAAIQAPRYAPYTMLFGLGVVLFVVGKVPRIGRARPIVAGVLAIVVAANLVGSVDLSRDESGERLQASQTEGLQRYADGEADQFNTFLSCGDWLPCLEGAWFMQDHQLSVFTDSEAPPAWRAGLLDATYDRFRESSREEADALCAWITNAGPTELEADLLARDGLMPFLQRNEVALDGGDLSEAAGYVGRAMTVECRARTLSAGASALGDGG